MELHNSDVSSILTYRSCNFIFINETLEHIKNFMDNKVIELKALT